MPRFDAAILGILIVAATPASAGEPPGPMDNPLHLERFSARWSGCRTDCESVLRRTTGIGR
jgi:hypothetical protein